MWEFSSRPRRKWFVVLQTETICVSSTKYLSSSCRYCHARLFALFAPSVQRTIIYEACFRNHLLKSFPTVWTVAFYYKQPNRSVVLSNVLFRSNTFKSLISKKHCYFVFHISSITMLTLVAQRICHHVAAGSLQEWFRSRIARKMATFIQNLR